MRSALIVGEMGSGKTTFIEAKLGEAVRLLLEDHGVDESLGYATFTGERLACRGS
jgi:KaiC/GvpD/RAD55 family RecA-like ATPase